MSTTQPDLDSFIATMTTGDGTSTPRPFDRMMFDVCGEVNHVCSAYEQHVGNFKDALNALDRSCTRIYDDPEVGVQRKYSLRVAEWMLKSWCVWKVPGFTRQTATRWFDAWQHERNLAQLQL